MARQDSGSNGAVIIAAIIGAIGAIIAAFIARGVSSPPSVSSIPPTPIVQPLIPTDRTSNIEPTISIQPTATNAPIPTNTPEPTATNAPIPTNTPEPPAVSRLEPFFDAFDGSLSPNWIAVGSDIQVNNGLFTSQSGALLYNAISRNYIIRTQATGEFAIHFRMHLVRNRLTDGYSFECTYEYCRWNLRRYEVNKNQFNLIYFSNELPHNINLDEFNNIEVQVRDNQFTVNINGQNFSIASNDLHKDGMVGIGRAYYGGTVSFNTFEVTNIE